MRTSFKAMSTLPIDPTLDRLYAIAILRKEVAVSDTLLSTSQAAERLGVSIATINNWIDKGMMPHAYKLSGHGKSPYRIPVKDVEAIETQRRGEQQHTAA